MGNEKQRKTFLSYSRANKDFAIKLAKELKSEGFLIWLDQLDIPAGSRWDREVEKALEECEIFMIILTPASINSENVLDEIGYAVDNGKRFLPVMLETCNVPLRLRRFQYVDFTTKSFDDGVESAKDLLRNLIAQITISRTDVPAESQNQMAQAEREAKAVAERKEKTKPVPAMPVEMIGAAVSAASTQKESISKGLLIGIVVVLAIVIGGIGFSALSNRGTPATDLLGAIKQRGYILVSTDPQYEPASFLNATGKRLSNTKCPSDTLTTSEMQGFDVDVAIEFGNQLGVEICFATPAWDTITSGGWAGKWDISIGSMTITIERQQVLDFSIPYYYDEEGLPFGAAFDKSSSLPTDTLRVEVDKLFTAMHNNGRLSELSIKWYGKDITQNP